MQSKNEFSEAEEDHIFHRSIFRWRLFFLPRSYVYQRESGSDSSERDWTTKRKISDNRNFSLMIVLESRRAVFCEEVKRKG